MTPEARKHAEREHRMADTRRPQVGDRIEMLVDDASGARGWPAGTVATVLKEPGVNAISFGAEALGRIWWVCSKEEGTEWRFELTQPEEYPASFNGEAHVRGEQLQHGGRVTLTIWGRPFAMSAAEVPVMITALERAHRDAVPVPDVSNAERLLAERAAEYAELEKALVTAARRMALARTPQVMAEAVARTIKAAQALESHCA